MVYSDKKRAPRHAKTTAKTKICYLQLPFYKPYFIIMLKLDKMIYKPYDLSYNRKNELDKEEKDHCNCTYPDTNLQYSCHNFNK